MYGPFSILTACLLLLLSHPVQGQGFRENAGQVVDEEGLNRTDVLYSYHAQDRTIHLRKGGFSYQFVASCATQEPGVTVHDVHRIDVDLVGMCDGSSPQVGKRLGLDRYYLPQAWGVRAATYDEVRYQEVFEGVDIRFATVDGAFKYDVECEGPLALDRIRFRYRGSSDDPVIGPSGELRLKSRFGVVIERIPKSFLCSNGQCKDATVRVKRTELPDVFGFELVGEWPAGSRLIIDPMPHRLWSTYTGGQGYDELTSVAMDEEGNTWVAGHTDSFENIATSGAFQTTLLGFQNCFLQKYSPQGQLLSGTYFGGTLADRCYALVLEPGTQHVYLGGGTFSSGIATPGAHQTELASVDDALLLKFSGDGDLLWSTYYGGPGHDLIAAMCLDANGDLVMTGHTRSVTGVTTDGSSLLGVENVITAKFSPDGELRWGTVLGASVDEGWGIGVDQQGSVFVSGTTSSFVNISTPGAHQTDNAGGRDAFLAKYTSDGALLWSTYIGGPGNDASQDLVVSGDGSVVVLGSTESNTGIASMGAPQVLPASPDDGFLARFSPSGARLWGTYLGGEQLDEFTALVEEPDGGFLLGGWSQSSTGVTTPGAFQQFPAGEFDAVLVRCDANGALQWGTFIGGPLSEYAYDLARDPLTGHAVLVGFTRSTEGVASPEAQATEFSGGLYDGFIARFCVPPIPSITAQDGLILCGSGPFGFALDAEFDAMDWNVGGSDQELLWTPPGLGTFQLYVDVVDETGCPGSSDTLQVLVAPEFDPGLILIADPSAPACVGTEVLLSVAPAIGSIEWWNGANGASTSVVLMDTIPVQAVVTVYNEVGCAVSDSMQVQAKDCTSVHDLDRKEKPVRLYPNPSADRLYIDAPASTVFPITLAFHATDGRLVHQQTLARGQAFQHGLGPGMYMVHVVEGDGVRRVAQLIQVEE